MKLCLLERLHGAERNTVMMGFQHDPLTLPLFEPKYTHERLHYMLHGVPVIIMEENLVKRDMRRVVFNNRPGLC